MIEAAKTSPQRVRCCDWKSAMAMGRVRLVASLMATFAQGNSSQLYKKVKMVTVARPGLESGRMMRVKICHGLAPSMRAASSRSRGMLAKKPRS